MHGELFRRLAAMGLLVGASYRYARPAYSLLRSCFSELLLRHLFLGSVLALYSGALLIVAHGVGNRREWARTAGMLAAALWCLSGLQHDLPLYEYFQPSYPVWIVAIFIFAAAAALIGCLWPPFFRVSQKISSPAV